MQVRRKKATPGWYPDAAQSQTEQRKLNAAESKEQVDRYATAMFEPADCVEIRRIRKEEVTGKSNASSVFCQASGLVNMLPRLLRENGEGWNIYISANARNSKGGRKAADVKCARSLFADWDLTTLSQARKKWEAAGLPAPSMVITSGHGIHAYWILDEPLSDMSEWTALQKALARAVESDPAVCDAPRVMRLPGFNNVKGMAVPCRIL